MAVMNYKQTNRYPDGTGMLLDTTPGSPDSGSYTTEAQLKAWTNADIISGAQVVGKAQKDQNGNVIDATYETKSDALVMKGAIEANDARISNLEQKAGDYSLVQYRGTNAVPTGKAKYALVDKLVGKSRGWNNIFDKTKLRVQSGTPSVSDGTIVFSGNGLIDESSTLGISGHTYLLVFTYKNSISGTTKVNNYLRYPDVYTIPTSSSYSTFATIFTATAKDTINFDVSNYVSGSLEIKEIMLRDLTLIFPEGVPATVAECVQKCPDILKYDAYGYSLVSTTVEGVVSKGVNLFNEVTEQGIIYSTGSLSPSTETGRRSADYSPCLPLQTYYGYFGSTGNLFICFYDSAKNFISRENIQNQTKVAPANAYFFKLSTDSSYGATYKGDICINISSSLNGQYFPYEKHTLSLSTPVTLRSAGAVSEVLTVQTGKKTRPVYNINLGSLNWSYSSGCMISQALDIAGKTGSYGSDNNVTCGKYVPRPTRAYSDDYSNYQCGLSVNGTQLVIKDPNYGSSDTAQFKSDMDGVYLNYERNTPDTDQSVCDPIPNNFTATQGGGTVNTIQTQSPVIDNCMDVGYLAL